MSVDAVAHQAAGVDVIALGVDRGNSVMPGQRDDLVAAAEEECIGAWDQRGDTLLGHRLEGSEDFSIRARGENGQSETERVSRRHQLCRKGIVWIGGISQIADRCASWQDLA